MNTTYGVLNNSSLIIDTDKLRENVRTILRSLPAGTKLTPVVKDDAYGMGMVGVARTLSAFPEIGCFAVANVSEGVTLRREGIRQDILIMGSTLPFQYAPAIECDLTVTVSRLGMVPELAEGCKGQLPPMYRAFLDLCRGTVADGVVQVYAPDDITKGRLDNDRVLGVLRAQGESLTGGPVQVRLIVGTPPAVSPDQRREMLIQFGSQFDAVRIED